jgi:hypothetical protein
MPTVQELLHEAAMGRVGVDRRLIRSILADPDAAAGIVKYARASHDGERLEIEALLVDLFRQLRPVEALEFYLDAIRHTPDDVSDDLIQAVLPFGENAVAPLIALYEELGEEQGADVAFLLAGLHVRDPRILTFLLERLEYDAADGAFALGLYGDPQARPALEKMLAEISEEDKELRREIGYALEQLNAPSATYEPEAFDIFAEYKERELPAFDVLPEPELLALLKSEDTATRAGAAHSFFNAELNAKSKAALFEIAKSDPEASVRAKAWESLADVTAEKAIREAMIAVMNDASRSIDERGGAAVGLYGVADQDDARPGVEALYEAGGQARAKALESMWRSLWEPFAKYFPQHLDDKDPAIVREALRGTGYFQLTRYADRIAKYFDAEEPFHRLREDALFAYALAMPGETTRGRARGMLRKVDSITPLTAFETELVEFALDERLRLHGLQPVFADESKDDQDPAPAPPPPPPQKIGRNDPCPCGSGKKYKKCHGAS